MFKHESGLLPSTQPSRRVLCDRLIRESLENKYFESFNFYFAKPVNEILANSRVSQTILFKDYAFLDNRHESMRRWYTTPESVLRLNNYADFFAEIDKKYYAYITSHDTMKIMRHRMARV